MHDVRIQVTNDDGISSEGLQELVRHLAATEHEIVVIAPDADWSGAGTSLASSGEGYVNLGEIRSCLLYTSADLFGPRVPPKNPECSSWCGAVPLTTDGAAPHFRPVTPCVSPIPSSSCPIQQRSCLLYTSRCV